MLADEDDNEQQVFTLLLLHRQRRKLVQNKSLAGRGGCMTQNRSFCLWKDSPIAALFWV
jgi:hypothetical protein